MSLSTPPLFSALADAQRILIAEAGGGFDVYAGLPLAIALHDRGQHVHLANLAFTYLELLELDAWQTHDGVRRSTAGVSPPMKRLPAEHLASMNACLEDRAINDVISATHKY